MFTVIMQILALAILSGLVGCAVLFGGIVLGIRLEKVRHRKAWRTVPSDTMNLWLRLVRQVRHGQISFEEALARAEHVWWPYYDWERNAVIDEVLDSLQDAHTYALVKQARKKLSA